MQVRVRNDSSSVWSGIYLFFWLCLVIETFVTKLVVFNNKDLKVLSSFHVAARRFVPYKLGAHPRFEPGQQQYTFVLGKFLGHNIQTED